MPASPISSAAPPASAYPDASPDDADRIATRPRRRLTQVSLGGLLTVVIVCAGLLAARNWWIRPYIVQAEAEQALLELGAKLESQPGSPAFLTWLVGPNRFHRVVSAHLENSQAADKDLVHLHRLPWLERLYLAKSRVTDAGLKHVGYCERLRRMSLWGNPGVTDRGLADVGRITSLEVLDIHSTNVTDAGLVHLTPLSRLRFVKLPHLVTGEGLTALTTLPDLVELDLSRSGVGDAGVAVLPRAPRLEALTVSLRMTDRSCLALADCRSLTRLDLGSNNRITAEGLTVLPSDRLVTLESTYRAMALSDPARFNHAILRQTGLSSIQLNGAALTQDDLNTLANRPAVREVKLFLLGLDERPDLDPTNLGLARIQWLPDWSGSKRESWVRPMAKILTDIESLSRLMEISPSRRDGTANRSAHYGPTRHDRSVIELLTPWLPETDSDRRGRGPRSSHWVQPLLGAAGADLLREARVERLTVFGCAIQADALEILATDPNLTDLELFYCVWADDVPTQDGQPLPPQVPALFGMAVAGSTPRVTPAWPGLRTVIGSGPGSLDLIADLSATASLETIRAHGGWQRADALARLRLTPSCRVLEAPGVVQPAINTSDSGSDAFLSCLQDAVNLENLDLLGYVATSADVEAIVHNHPDLKSLRLDAVNLTMSDFERLRTLRHLRELRLRSFLLPPGTNLGPFLNGSEERLDLMIW